MRRDQIPAFHQEYSIMTLFIGIEIGTSAVTAVLLENGNRLIAASSAELPAPMIDAPRIEQDPTDWLVGTQDALKELRKIGRHRKTHFKARRQQNQADNKHQSPSHFAEYTFIEADSGHKQANGYERYAEANC